MNPRDDDLHGWSDDPLVRALTGPGSAAELAGEAEALAAFRRAKPRGRRHRSVTRIGVTGGALGAAVVLSAGAAAAYSGALPQSIQRAAHQAFGEIGVPAPGPRAAVSTGQKHRPPHLLPVPASAAVSPAPTVAPRSPAATAPASRRGGDHPARAHAPRRTAAPTPQPTGTAVPVAPTPSPATSTSPPAEPTTPPPVTTGSITIALSASTVPVGGTVTVTGRLAAADGAPVEGRRVWLVERPVDGAATRVGSAPTDADGSVTLTSPDLATNARLRLVEAGVRSAAMRVVVRPNLTVSVTPGPGTDTVHLTATGADAGDIVAISRRVRGGWQPVAASQVDSAGAATFDVAPPPRHPVRYRAVLDRTRRHGAAATRFVVPPPA